MRAFFCNAVFVAFSILALTVNAAEIEVIDDSGRAVLLKSPARRVISLSPHITELIFAAGGADKLVATSDGGNSAAQALSLPTLGDSRALDPARVAAYKPDLIIGWLTSELDSLAVLNIPMFISAPTSLMEIADSVETFGVLLGTAGVAHGRAESLRQKLDTLSRVYAGKRLVRVLLQSSTEPDSALTREHPLSDIISLCAGVNVITDENTNPQKLGRTQLAAKAPELVLIARAGAPATPVVDTASVTDWRTVGLAAARLGRVYMIDADVVFRPGPRLIEAAQPICELVEQTRR